jgi:hypothetical protein
MACTTATTKPDRLVFVERWADAAALQAHFRVPASRRFVEALTALAVAPPSMQLYGATPLPAPGVGTVYGRRARPSSAPGRAPGPQLARGARCMRGAGRFQIPAPATGPACSPGIPTAQRHLRPGRRTSVVGMLRARAAASAGGQPSRARRPEARVGALNA